MDDSGDEDAQVSLPSSPQPKLRQITNSTPSPRQPPHDREASMNRPGGRTSPPETPRSPKEHGSSTIPTAYRPGRLSNIEILERIFPMQKKTVLELVMQGCNGDLVKAIEHFLSAQDTIMAQQNAQPPAHSRAADVRSHPYITAMSPYSRHSINGLSKPIMTFGNVAGGDGVKSAFTPLSHASYGSLHAAFTPRAAAFTAEALLGRSPGSLPGHSRPNMGDASLLTAPPGLTFPGLGPIPTSIPTGFGPPLFMTPYRPFPTELPSATDKLTDKQFSEKLPHNETDHSSDGWESPTKTASGD